MTRHVPVSPATTSLGRIAQAGTVLHEHLVAQVHAQRLAGASWAAIGGLLGVTKQSAHQRFRYLDELPVAVMRTRDHGVVFCSLDTGAVLTSKQLEQVRSCGVIVQHHELLGAPA